MTEKYLTTYKGFGEEHTLEYWANRFNFTPGFMRNLVRLGKSIEEIAEFFNITYTGPRPRKPREGARMIETRQLVEDLFWRSGYETEPERVTVEPIYKTYHAVYYDGERLGTFDYATGILSNLHGGGILPLKAGYSHQLVIYRDEQGHWTPTAETKAIVASQLLADREERKCKGTY